MLLSYGPAFLLSSLEVLFSHLQFIEIVKVHQTAPDPVDTSTRLPCTFSKTAIAKSMLPRGTRFGQKMWNSIASWNQLANKASFHI
jgi:hypothetical protein